jgi:hypothetical protein
MSLGAGLAGFVSVFIILGVSGRKKAWAAHRLRDSAGIAVGGQALSLLASFFASFDFIKQR